MTAPDERARAYLDVAQRHSVEALPPTILMRECAELRRLLGQVLAVLAERQDDARQLTQIRALLADFDWQHSDRQLALEAIDHIVTGES